MRKLICVLLVCVVLLSGCGEVASGDGKKQYTATFLTLFDTVTSVVGRADSEEDFSATAQQIHDGLLVYHQLFDIYNDYEGINNLKTVNDQAGIAPVKVDPAIVALLADCKEFYTLTGGKVNVAMGGVLKLWHEARADGINDPVNARLPDTEALKAASMHASLSNVILDAENSTVLISDPLVQLDVGAIAKGWAAQKVAESVPAGLLISVGGNVCATGPKDTAGTPWVVGVQNPDGGEEYLHTLYITGGSVVTSGDYQRTYMVDGRLYHHIIDPQTLYPGKLWRSVTVICPDSGTADALSTALFLLPLEEGKQLLAQCGAEAMWVDSEGTIHYTPGFQNYIRT